MRVPMRGPESADDSRFAGRLVLRCHVISNCAGITFSFGQFPLSSESEFLHIIKRHAPEYERAIAPGANSRRSHDIRVPSPAETLRSLSPDQLEGAFLDSEVQTVAVFRSAFKCC